MTKLPTTGKERRRRRHRRIREAIKGSASQPRLSVFRSNRHVYIQLIDDDASKTLIGLSTRSLSDTVGGSEKARRIGEQLAEQAQAKGITTAVFDRGGYRYHGRVAAIAAGARSKGLKL